MKKIIQKFFLLLLNFTPIGFIFSALHFIEGKATPGVYVVISKHQPFEVILKKNPFFTDRVDWFFRGLLLLFQAYIVVANQWGGDIGAVYSWFSSIFGVVCVISALFPTFPWNERRWYFPLSLLELWVITLLILSVVLPDLIGTRVR